MYNCLIFDLVMHILQVRIILDILVHQLKSSFPTNPKFHHYLGEYDVKLGINKIILMPAVRLLLIPKLYIYIFIFVVTHL